MPWRSLDSLLRVFAKLESNKKKFKHVKRKRNIKHQINTKFRHNFFNCSTKMKSASASQIICTNPLQKALNPVVSQLWSNLLTDDAGCPCLQHPQNKDAIMQELPQCRNKYFQVSTNTLRYFKPFLASGSTVT